MKHINKKIGAAIIAAFVSQAEFATGQTVQDIIYRYQYDANGNLKQITDPLGRVTDQSYDALNRLTQQQQPAPASGGVRPAIKYSYDGLDQLTGVTDPRNLTTSYTVNGLGDRTVLSSPDTGATNNTYDEAGNLKTSTNAKGETTTYTYDALSRITRIAYADGNAIDYAYDQGENGIGRLTRITDVSGTTDYTYDKRGRVLSETRSIAGTPYVTRYSYDGAGRLKDISYPSGRIISYTRDGLGRITQIDATIGGVTQTLVSQVNYQPFGGVQSFVNGAGQAVSRSYDLAGRITAYSLRGQMQLINYDNASRIKFIADTAPSGVTTNYGYDDLDRLTSVLRPDKSLGYSYDAVGNRINQTNGAAVTGYSYAPTSNRLTQVSGSQTHLINTDANGSITNNGRNSFTYDSRGRLVSANTALGIVQYRINGLGQRVLRITPSETTVFHYDVSGKLIGESSGQSGKDYVYLNDTPVAVLTQ